MIRFYSQHQLSYLFGCKQLRTLLESKNTQWIDSLTHTASAGLNQLTHWGQMMHLCISKLTIIGSDNDLSPGRRQAIIWINAGILLIGPLETNFSEISIEIHTFPFTKLHLKMSSGKWRPFCPSLNVLNLNDIPMNHWMVLKDFIYTISWLNSPKTFMF